ncbi:MAG: MBL fold metallo-hydrolase [Bacteroidia bacterium]|nr:MBL fold metallo-hydrolase [Bacteroidia bacterium]
MISIQTFIFNPFQENTYVVSDDTGACAIIDPGCYSQSEQQALYRYIEKNKLQVQLLLNTHGHIDHMLGNYFVKDTWQVPFVTHRLVVPELESTKVYGATMGIFPHPSPAPDKFVEEGDTVKFGETELEVLFTPGHSAGHISFLHRLSGNIFSGDVLFQGSIGRTDLPGGSFPQLMRTIYDKFLTLNDSVVVHCGHGPSTTIGKERRSNNFILNYPPE